MTFPQMMQIRVTFWSNLVFLTAVIAALTALAQRPPPQNLREMLALHGIDASHLDRLQDGEATGPADEEVIVRILQRWPRFPPQRLEEWSRSAGEAWPTLAGSPAESRATVVRLTGRVVRVEQVPLLPELAARLDFDHYFQVTLELGSEGQTALLCARTIPQQWRLGQTIDEPAGALGIFLKSEAEATEPPRLVFVTNRVAWFPDRAGGDRQVSPSDVYLASLGFDVGLFDTVQSENKKPLSLADRDCFYGLLAAIRGAERPDFLAQSSAPLNLVLLLREPASHHGELSTVEGIARRAVKVRVDDAEVRQRWGIDHYYQIDLFVELNRQVIRLATQKDNDEQPTFENAYPITICVPSLPAELPESDTIRENVRVHAAFFKLWSYPSDYMASFDRQLLQVSPMLIGIEPRVIQVTAVTPAFGAGLIVLLVVTLGGIWIGLMRHGRAKGSRGPGDDERELPDRPDFGNLGG